MCRLRDCNNQETIEEEYEVLTRSDDEDDDENTDSEDI